MKNIESLDFRSLTLSAKYGLFLAYTAKHTQMSFSRCRLARFFAGCHRDYSHLYVMHNRGSASRSVAPQDRVANILA